MKDGSSKLLWDKINQFEIDDPDSLLTFTDRLARENGWTIDFSVRTVAEYKKFMFLICISTHPLTPSDQVDQVWHLHLLYTRSYWDDFCTDILQRKIHHGPTRGGDNEKTKYSDWYSKTKEFYEIIFKEVPPSDIWPSSEIRFKEINFQRVNIDKNWVIKKINIKLK